MDEQASLKKQELLTSYYSTGLKQTYSEYLSDKTSFWGRPETALYKYVSLPAQLRQLLIGAAGCRHYDIMLPSADSISASASNPETAISLSYAVWKEQDGYSIFSPAFDWKLIHLFKAVTGIPGSTASQHPDSGKPGQIRTSELYNQAIYAFDQKHYSVAESLLEAAVKVSSASPWKDNEWRLYRLLGVLHLGFMGCDVTLVDLEKAVQNFISSAELTGSQNQDATALSYLAAGWAAWCRSELIEAMYCTEQARGCKSNWGETDFQMAKILISAGNVKDSLFYLDKAIDTDAFYALKAAVDYDFRSHSKALLTYFEALHKDLNLTSRNRIKADLLKFKESKIPLELEKTLVCFMQDKPLLEIRLNASEWNQFKLKPWFYSQNLGNIRIKPDSAATVLEPYQEKLILKAAGWFHNEKARLVRKSTIAESHAQPENEVKAVRDTFTFFSGRLMADFSLIQVEEGSFVPYEAIDETRPAIKIKPFLISCHQVTQKLWNLVMGNIPARFTGYDLPVEQVSLFECVEFCNKLSVLAGFTPYYRIEKCSPDISSTNPNPSEQVTVEICPEATGYRIPTETEWEYAARGGKFSGNFLYAGSNEEDKVACYKNNSHEKTQSVGIRQSNELGLYDMSGNVWEWCWVQPGTGCPDETINLYKSDQPGSAVVRGGSWADAKDALRCTSRWVENPHTKSDRIGFRIIRNLPVTQ